MNAPPNPATGSGGEDRTQSAPTLRLWGSFELRELVGRGSFGEVYRAWDPHLQREVGLKILLDRPGQSTAPYEEILREARALAAVRHPNVPPVYGVDRHDGRVGFWTDFVHGKTLAAMVREQGPFGCREAALIGLDVSKALSAVHRVGLLHRDIKAENVMREEGGRILLMDFGLSTLGASRPGSAGTLRCMAPELLRGGGATIASDVYAVGVLLFFLVTGRHPSQPADSIPSQSNGGGDVGTELEAVTATQAGPASSSDGNLGFGHLSVLDLRPDLPEGFARIVQTAMQSDPKKRYLSAGAMSGALAEMLGAAPGEVSAPTRRSPHPRWIGAATLALVLAMAGVWWHEHRRTGSSQVVGSAGVPATVNEEFLKADSLLRQSYLRRNVDQAVALLQDVLAKNPDFALAQAGLCRADMIQYANSGVPSFLDQARLACERAISINSDLAAPYASLATMDADEGHTDLATQEIENAIRLDPNSAEVYGAQSRVLEAEGRTADAEAALQKAADLDPADWSWPIMLGVDEFNDGKLDEAAAAIRQSLSDAPDNPIAIWDLGLVALQQGNYPEAEEEMRESIAIQPTYGAYSAMSEVLLSEGKNQNAVDASRRALAMDPKNYLAWGNLAASYQTIPADQAQSMAAFRKAIQLGEIARKATPQDPTLLSTLSGYYAFVGDADRALPLVREALSLAPDNPDILFAAGDTYEILHQRDQAIPLIARSVALGFHTDELKNVPELRPLRQDPAFQQALRAALANRPREAAEPAH